MPSSTKLKFTVDLARSLEQANVRAQAIAAVAPVRAGEF